jgi:hypothetical protein
MKKMLLIPAAIAATLAFGCTDYSCLVPAGTTANSKLSICHVTGKAGKYELISVKASAAQAHADHGDFLAPAGAKKNSDCVEPVTVPPVTVPPTGTGTSTGGGTTVPPVTVPPTTIPVVDSILDPVKQLPDSIKTVSCIVDPSQPQCQL